MIKFEAAEGGEILYFKHAVVARVETNKNMDEISEEGAYELASSIAVMPIDDDHIEQRIVGIFSDAEVEEGAVSTNGVIYARRFPDIVSDLYMGKRWLSIEADAEMAECSVCGGRFKRKDELCAHLCSPIQVRRKEGYRRKLSGLRAIGGGITPHPAGTDTSFDPTNFKMVAHVEWGLDEEDRQIIEQIDTLLRQYGLRVLNG